MYLKLLVILSCLTCAGYAKAITRAPTRAHTRAKASVSETAILPFHLNTTLNKSNLKVTWRFYGTPVISYESGKLNQGKDYKNRALLFDEEEIAKGNVSLQLKDVTEKDAGKYTCTVDGENINENGFVSLDILIHVTATVNGTAILPVHLRTKLDKPTITVEWTFSNNRVGDFSNNKTSMNEERPTMAYKERASFFEDEIAEGNISLKLVNITEEDFGKYTCVFHDKNNNEKKFFSFLVKAHINEGSEGETTKAPKNKSHQLPTGTKIALGVGGVLVVLVVVGGAVTFNQRRKCQRPAADTASQIRYNAAAPEEDLFIDEPQERQPNNPNSEETERMNVLETRTPTNTTEVVNRRRNGGAIE